jgi:hypothetical protein
VIGPGIVEAKEDHTCWGAAGESQYLTEIQVKCEYDPSFGRGLQEDIAIGQLVQSFIAKVPDIMATTL